MGLIMPDELKKMIPVLEENISLAKSILEKDPNNTELQLLLKSQKETLKKYKERIGLEEQSPSTNGPFNGITNQP